VWRADAGFDASRAMTFGFVMRDQQYPATADMTAFVSRVTDAMNAVPGIEAAGLTTHLPLNDNNFENSFTVDGFEVRQGEDPPIAAVRAVAGHYRAALGARLLRGRDLQASDTARSQPVVMVTEGFVRRYVRAADPIGARLRMGGPDDPWRTIVGVIADIRHNGLDQEPRPEVWFPYTQMDADVLATWLRAAYVTARASTDPATAMPSLRAAMRGLDSSMPLLDPQPLSDLARSSVAERRIETFLLSTFAAIATVLAAVGLFGILAFHVAQHVQEFGVRLALGATPSGLMRLVITRGLWLLGIGLLLGIPGAFAMGRGMSALLYSVEPTDPIALGAAVALLAGVTLLACALPARRAMKTDPLVALRAD
jgi:predicted permease